MKKMLWLLGFLILVIPSYAQENDFTVSTNTDTIWYTEEIIVTATRTGKNVFELPRSVMVLNDADLGQQMITRMPDALQEIPEIAVQRTTLGGGSPIMRGLVGRHVLVLIDGVRLNTSTNRSGPHQYFNTIDPNLVDRIEIVHGPGSVLYGSDALGGVINIITKKPAKTTGFKMFSDTRAATADKGIMQHLQLNYRDQNFGTTVGISFKKFNDLHAGREIGLQTPTAYSQWDGMLLFDYAFSDKAQLHFSLQNTSQDNVPRFDRIAAGKDQKYSYDPQDRQLAHLSLSQDINGSFLHSFKADLSFQRQSEGTNIISNKNINNEVRDRVRTSTFGLGLTFDTILGSIHLLTYGLEYYFDRISSSRDTLNVNTYQTAIGPAPYPGDPTYQSAALFIQDEIFLNRFLIITGLRYSYYELKADLSTTDNLSSFGTLTSNPSALSGNLNVTYMIIPEKLNIYAGISQGFRAPNANDLIAIGNISSYYMNLWDFILRREAGEDAGTVILKKENASRAKIIGLNMSGFYKPFNNWQISSGISWTQGDDLDNAVPMSMIPPLRANFSAMNSGKNYWVELFTLFSSTQNRLSPLDILSPRIGPNGTPGYVIFTWRGGYKFSNHIELSTGIENIFNRTYKIHGSGISSAGRNFYIGLILST
jgi:outer membrane receptor protein involved in Fe transport